MPEIDQSNPYAVLGVKRTANDAQILAAYRKQAKAHHPDKHAAKGDVERNAHEAQFRRAKWAYDILSAPQERAYYDTYGRTREAVRNTPPTPVELTLRGVLKEVASRQLRHDTDFIYQMRLLITDERIAARERIRTTENTVALLRKMSRRFLRDGDPENTLSRLLAEDVQKGEAEIATLTAHADHLHLCLDELQHFTCAPADSVPMTAKQLRR